MVFLFKLPLPKTKISKNKWELLLRKQLEKFWNYVSNVLFTDTRKLNIIIDNLYIQKDFSGEIELEAWGWSLFDYDYSS